MKRTILYAQYANSAAYPPVLHSAALFANAGWTVTVLHIADSATATLTIPQQPNISVRQLPYVARGWRRAFYFLQFTLWVLWWTLRVRPHWLYASDLFATPAALVASFFPSVRVVYHEHDTPDATRRLAQWCLRARGALAKRAALCVFPNAARAQTFAQQFDAAAKTYTVWNCPARAEVSPPPARDDIQVRLLYHGSVVPSRLPLTVLDALAQLPENVCLRIVGYETIGHAGYVETVLARARALALSARVEWLGQVPTRADLLRLARACDVGLALMPMGRAAANERTMTGASNKPFDYLACGLDFIVSDLADWRALFVENGFARACNPQDAATIAAAVRWFFQHADERGARAARAQAKILDEWNYETQFAPVFARMTTDAG